MFDHILQGQIRSFDMKQNNSEETSPLSRRAVLKNGLLFMAAGSVFVPGLAHATAIELPKTGAFNVAFRNQHTGESFSGTYRVGNKYLPEAFDQINNVLRDFRVNEVFPIDPRVIDIIFMVREKAGRSNDTLEVLSGYRSPKTNARLRRVSTGVAKNSLHMTGQALDFRLPGYSSRKLKQVAYSVRGGGVGYYPSSNFVHVDTGKVRHWG